MNIEELIKQAEELKSVAYDSPKTDLWERRTKSFVEQNYGKEYLEILERALFFGQVIMSESHGQQMHVEALIKAMEFLESLKTEPQIDKNNQRNVPTSDRQDKGLTPRKANFGNITISGGTVVFGDGNRITQVAVKELVDALSEEIKEKVLEGQEKQNILHSLKEITTNETFASVAGTVIGEILRRVTRP